MGGPFWARKQERAWSVPKGEHSPEEDAWAAAVREWGEETGLPLPGVDPVPLGSVRQSGPELDRFAWVDLDTARGLLVAGQVPFLDRLLASLG